MVWRPLEAGGSQCLMHAVPKHELFLLVTFTAAWSCYCNGYSDSHPHPCFSALVSQLKVSLCTCSICLDHAEPLAFCCCWWNITPALALLVKIRPSCISPVSITLIYLCLLLYSFLSFPTQDFWAWFLFLLFLLPPGAVPIQVIVSTHCVFLLLQLLVYWVLRSLCVTVLPKNDASLKGFKNMEEWGH